MQHTVLAVASWFDFGPFKMPKFVKDFYVRYKKYKTYKTTVKELSALTDRELKDLGIPRGMIHSIAMEVYLNKGEA